MTRFGEEAGVAKRSGEHLVRLVAGEPVLDGPLLLGPRLVSHAEVVEQIAHDDDPACFAGLAEVLGFSDEPAHVTTSQSKTLGHTLAKWFGPILARFDTGASNGPTEGLNLCVKKVKRAGHGFRCFEHYRLRVLLHAGGVTWPTRPRPPRIRTRTPYSFA